MGVGSDFFDIEASAKTNRVFGVSILPRNSIIDGWLKTIAFTLSDINLASARHTKLIFLLEQQCVSILRRH